MRVALFGNVCNNLFQLAKALRASSNIDAHLFVDETHDVQMLPESDDPSLAGNYPPWIHRGRFFPREHRVLPWRSPLAKELARFDVVIVSSNGPMFAQFSGRPTCFFVTGADLLEMPFPRMYRFRTRTVRERLDALVCAAWQRRGIKQMTEIWAPPFSPILDSLERLHSPIEQRKRIYFPIAIDAERFSIAKANRAAPHARAMRRNFEFVVFHPSRLMIRTNDDLPPAHAEALVKRNDVLLRGFAELVRRTNVDAGLAIIDREASPDRDVARSLARELRIEDRIVWLEPPRAGGFTRSELVDLYAESDIVADDFSVGWFGSIVLEALCAERPVVSYVDEAVVGSLYPWHPILSAKTPLEIAERLRTLAASRTERAEIGARGRRWIEEFHSGPRVARVYFDAFAGLAERLGLPAPEWTSHERPQPPLDAQ